jgi:hypothetical protein
MDVVRDSLGLVTPQVGAYPIVEEHFALGAEPLKERAVKMSVYLMVRS